MTPFIDVMLVLLIIFMVAAPLIATGVPLDLPQTGAKPINVDQKPVTIAIDGKGQIFLMDEPTLEPDLVTKLQGLAKQGFDEKIPASERFATASCVCFALLQAVMPGAGELVVVADGAVVVGGALLGKGGGMTVVV